MKEEQPKDFYEDVPEVQTFEEFLNQEYNALPFYGKVLYHLQNYIVLALVTMFLGGYLAGIRFGVFW